MPRIPNPLFAILTLACLTPVHLIAEVGPDNATILRPGEEVTVTSGPRLQASRNSGRAVEIEVVVLEIGPEGVNQDGLARLVETQALGYRMSQVVGDAKRQVVYLERPHRGMPGQPLALPQALEADPARAKALRLQIHQAMQLAAAQAKAMADSHAAQSIEGR